MCSACLYAKNMSKMIQIRDVPDQLHSTLKARAAQEGMSLSDYIKKELEQIAERPTLREWLGRVRSAKPIRMDRSAAEMIREMRDGR
jgi:plasmid stability protein